MDNNKKTVFIIGARGYTFKYGGWETFVRGLLDNWQDKSYEFFVVEKVSEKKDEGLLRINDFITLIKLYVKDSGGFTMMKYDFFATKYIVKFIKNNKINKPIMYYLGLRIGPYVFYKRRSLKRINATIVENAAGLEWKRTKWNFLVQIYLWISAYLMAKASDYLVCDSEGILTEYNRMIKGKRPIKLFIPYGTYTNVDTVYHKTEIIYNFLKDNDITEKNYYLIVSRFVPENSYELIISEFMKSNSKCDLVLVTNYKTEQKYFDKLLKKLNFNQDSRIKFVGAIYDKEILDYLRANTRGYINGHTLGGTNPGLLEAMSISDVNIVYDVIFARQVGLDTVLYYDKNTKRLSQVISECDAMTIENRKFLGDKAKQRMINSYSWTQIVQKYREFLNTIR